MVISVSSPSPSAAGDENTPAPRILSCAYWFLRLPRDQPQTWNILCCSRVLLLGLLEQVQFARPLYFDAPKLLMKSATTIMHTQGECFAVLNIVSKRSPAKDLNTRWRSLHRIVIRTSVHSALSVDLYYSLQSESFEVSGFWTSGRDERWFIFKKPFQPVRTNNGSTST